MVNLLKMLGIYYISQHRVGKPSLYPLLSASHGSLPSRPAPVSHLHKGHRPHQPFKETLHTLQASEESWRSVSREGTMGELNTKCLLKEEDLSHE